MEVTLALVVRILTTIFIAIVAYAWQIDPTALWGAYHLTFLPTTVAWGLLALALVASWLPDRVYEMLTGSLAKIESKTQVLVILTALSAATAVLFVVFRSQNMILGDAFKLLTQHDIMPGFSPTEHLTVLLMRTLSDILGDVTQGYTIVSAASGVVYIAIATSFALNATKSGLGRAAILLMFMSLGTIQNFFGYPENYSIALALSTAFLFFGWQTIRGKSPAWIAIAAFVLASAFHLHGAFLVPGMVYLLYHLGVTRNRASYRFASIGLGLIAVIGAVVFIASFGSDESLLTPLTWSADNPYSLVSIQHLKDIANIFILVAPVAIITLAVGLFAGKTGR